MNNIEENVLEIKKGNRLMKFELIPVDKIPEYISVYCDFDKGNHDHLPIIWRCSFRTMYAGWASWGWKYGMVNVYRLGDNFKHHNDYKHLVDDFLRVYYHEMLHLIFKFRLGKVFFKGKKRELSSNEKIIDLLARLLSMSEMLLYPYSENWVNEMLWEDVKIEV